MDPMSGIFRSRKVCAARLPDYGFLDEGGTYTYSTLLPGSGFLMSVKIARDGSVQAAVTDPETDEPYTLHLAGGAVGGFVGGVRAEYEQVLTDIAEKCFEPTSSREARPGSLSPMCAGHTGMSWNTSGQSSPKTQSGAAKILRNGTEPSSRSPAASWDWTPARRRR